MEALVYVRRRDQGVSWVQLGDGATLRVPPHGRMVQILLPEAPADVPDSGIIGQLLAESETQTQSPSLREGDGLQIERILRGADAAIVAQHCGAGHTSLLSILARVRHHGRFRMVFTLSVAGRSFSFSSVSFVAGNSGTSSAKRKRERGLEDNRSSESSPDGSDIKLEVNAFSTPLEPVVGSGLDRLFPELERIWPDAEGLDPDLLINPGSLDSRLGHSGAASTRERTSPPPSARAPAPSLPALTSATPAPAAPFATDALFIPGDLTVSGTVAARHFIQLSDVRLKANIADLTDALEAVCALQGKTYFWKKDVDNESDSRERRVIGLIAQEVQAVIPEAVFRDEETGYLGVSYTALVPVLVEALKIVSDRQDVLREEVSALAGQVQDLRDRGDETLSKFTHAVRSFSENNLNSRPEPIAAAAVAVDVGQTSDTSIKPVKEPSLETSKWRFLHYMRRWRRIGVGFVMLLLVAAIVSTIVVLATPDATNDETTEQITDDNKDKKDKDNSGGNEPSQNPPGNGDPQVSSALNAIAQLGGALARASWAGNN